MDRKIHFDLLQACAAATAGAVEQVCSVPVSAGRPSRRPSVVSCYGATLVLAFDGEFRGIASVVFPEDVVLALVGALTGEPCTAMDTTVTEGLRELAGVLIGMARTRLDGQGYQFRFAAPRIAIGHSHVKSVSGLDAVIRVPFDGALGHFDLDVQLTGLAADPAGGAERPAPD